MMPLQLLDLVRSKPKTSSPGYYSIASSAIETIASAFLTRRATHSYLVSCKPARILSYSRGLTLDRRINLIKPFVKINQLNEGISKWSANR